MMYILLSFCQQETNCVPRLVYNVNHMDRTRPGMPEESTQMHFSGKPFTSPQLTAESRLQARPNKQIVRQDSQQTIFTSDLPVFLWHCRMGYEAMSTYHRQQIRVCSWGSWWISVHFGNNLCWKGSIAFTVIIIYYVTGGLCSRADNASKQVIHILNLGNCEYIATYANVIKQLPFRWGQLSWVI